jgi:excinuclease ABC A subunit
MRAAIAVRGARTHNLRSIDLDIPHGRLVAFTGVSGSGKSSLVIDTVHTEAQRQLIETFSSFARQRLPKLSRPDVDSLENLTTSILIDQKPMGRNLRSTVGTATELHTYLRLLFARCGSRPDLPSFHLGFNNPQGACPRCAGVGRIVAADLDLLLDRDLSLRDGAVRHPDWKVGGWNWREVLVLGMFEPDVPLRNWDEASLDLLLHAEAVPVTRPHGAGAYTKTWRGIARRLEVAGAELDDGDDSPVTLARSRYLVSRTCPACAGMRLKPESLAVEVAGLRFGDALVMELSDLDAWLAGLPSALEPGRRAIAAPLVAKLRRLLGHLVRIGVGYLHVNRPVATLSGGEAQRVKTARQLDCDLTGLTYVLDEPSAGLHAQDVERLVDTLEQLRDRRNTVLVVEHDPAVIERADHVVEIGPGPGRLGGILVFSGPASDYLATGTGDAAGTTSPAPLRGRCNPAPRPWTRSWAIRGATANNLRGVDVDVPQGVLVVITGVAGSGKSTLVKQELLPACPDAIVVDQAPIGRTSRSTPVSYIGGFDRLRALFARATGAPASLFTFNSAGACAACKGAGLLRVEMSFLDEVDIPCEDCGGKRFREEVLRHRLRGHSIADVLDLTVVEAIELLGDDRVLRRRLDLLQTVGLGYLALGQPQSSLSGGEAQRLKIAVQLGNRGGLYVLDEPTTGLAASDVDVILGVLARLVDDGNSVIVVEHNLDVIAAADWIIDLGPGGGRHGGWVTATGTPAQVAETDTPTGRALAGHGAGTRTARR